MARQQDALGHPYVAMFHDALHEPVCRHPLRVEFDDNTKLTSKEYREKLYDVIKKKRETSRRKGYGSESSPSPPRIRSRSGSGHP